MFSFTLAVLTQSASLARAARLQSTFRFLGTLSSLSLAVKEQRLQGTVWNCYSSVGVFESVHLVATSQELVDSLLEER